jgi:tetratricopeptide (TPR) repeat protein
VTHAFGLLPGPLRARLARLVILGISGGFIVACGHSTPVANTSVKVSRPANPQAVGLMVRGVQMSKDPNTRSQALDLLQQAVAMDPELWEAHYDLGVVRAQGGDLAGAEGELAKAEALAPDEEEVAVAAGEVRRRRGENRAAADGLSRFVTAHPQATVARARYASSLRDAGQVDKAISEGREVLLRRPGDASALADLALSYLAKGQRETASLLAKQALAAATAKPAASTPTTGATGAGTGADASGSTNANGASSTASTTNGTAAAQRATALIALAAGEDAVAFNAFTAATDADRTDTTAQLDSGVVLLRAGVYNKAADHFRAVLKVVPDDAEAKIGLATAIRGQADAQHPQMYEDSRRLLGEVLARDPHDVSALYNLGVLYADFMKKPDLAHPLFQRFLDDAPADHPARAEAQRYLASTANAGGGVAPATPPAPAPATPVTQAPKGSGS